MNKAANLARALARDGRIVRSAFADARDPTCMQHLSDTLAPDDLALVMLFVSPAADARQVAADAMRAFGPVPVVGCTTAGELTPQGYTDGAIVAIGFPASHFDTRILPVPDLDAYDSRALIDQVIRNRHAMEAAQPDWPSDFTFLMIDGLSIKEDALTADLAPSLGPVPLFGGSAGDGEEFGQAFVIFDGAAHSNAAVLVQVHTRCPIQVFNTDHFTPTQTRMVVTGADPAQRLVSEINAEPAAREYARLLGKDPENLSTFTFAAHPVVVRIGGQHHVRSIQSVADNGDLVFFSAIDEGVVLSLAEPMDMARHLRRELGALGTDGDPDMILACDCMLRRIEAQAKQTSHELSRIMAEHRVVGFCTYGEQVNSTHVNQTLTGVAIYPPRDED
ncbi:MAG: FIST C-terminal domain-containing protein [Marinibacterium sp.]|nr:FIST C-terminal domain-containing protein [Marinibacterium sp.]